MVSVRCVLLLFGLPRCCSSLFMSKFVCCMARNSSMVVSCFVGVSWSMLSSICADPSILWGPVHMSSCGLLFACVASQAHMAARFS